MDRENLPKQKSNRRNHNGKLNRYGYIRIFTFGVVRRAFKKLKANYKMRKIFTTYVKPRASIINL